MFIGIYPSKTNPLSWELEECEVSLPDPEFQVRVAAPKLELNSSTAKPAVIRCSLEIWDAKPSSKRRISDPTKLRVSHTFDQFGRSINSAWPLISEKRILEHFHGERRVLKSLMNEVYTVKNLEEAFSPGLLIFRELLDHNLAEMVRIAGSPEKLRPHCKTHKTREIVKIQMELGITRHKCATIAEAEMLAEVGVKDILIAYQLVGPNLNRLVKLKDMFPATRFTCLVDCPDALNALSETMASANQSVPTMIDLNPGMNRTGIAPDQHAIELYEMMATCPGIELGGLHWYDGHQRDSDFEIRRGSVLAGWDQLTKFRNQLQLTGLSIPKVVAAGTGSFPILAEVGEPNLELSPGTTTYFDTGYREKFPEMKFQPALGILTRVVSKTGSRRVTFDVGHKSCSADQPAGNRLTFPSIPDAKEISHTEEHLVIETEQANELRVGQAVITLPRHACPSSAVHQQAYVIDNGQIVDTWKIASRNRFLSV